jgi:hypothetical protein
MTDPDVFTAAIAGLGKCPAHAFCGLRDDDRLDLGISPVRKSLNGADLRMLAYNGSVPGPTLHVEIDLPKKNRAALEKAFRPTSALRERTPRPLGGRPRKAVRARPSRIVSGCALTVSRT